MSLTNHQSPSGSPWDAGSLPEGPRGFRWTRQRREVYQVLVQERDHPTATELFLRAKAHIPDISLATVYNCLETLTQSGLVKQVNFERSSSRYCPNLQEHAHFYDEATGQVLDVELREGVDLHQLFKLPRGVRITRAEISLKGVFGTTQPSKPTPATTRRRKSPAA